MIIGPAPMIRMDFRSGRLGMGVNVREVWDASPVAQAGIGILARSGQETNASTEALGVNAQGLGRLDLVTPASMQDAGEVLLFLGGNKIG